MMDGLTNMAKQAANCDNTRSAYFSTLNQKNDGTKEAKKDIC